MSDPRYPIGKFSFPETLTFAQCEQFINDIAAAPAALRASVAGLDNTQLDTPYRDGGWTLRQVVHHVADSHMNSYVRFKLAATEIDPLISTYQEQHWAELADGKSLSVVVSLDLIDRLHERWVVFLKSLSEAELGRTFRHPRLGSVTLAKNLSLYSWHGLHHIAHITTLRQQKGW